MSKKSLINNHSRDASIESFMGIGKMNKKSRSISNRDLLYSTTSSKSIEKKNLYILKLILPLF